MCPLRHQTTDGINAICCRIKHNRAKPMSESASALFSIADAGEFRFARFYSVCEEVPLGTPESPLIVCGLSDTPRELSKRGKTQNSMSDAARKKYSDFTPKNAAAGCIWNLSFSLSPYKIYAILCFRNPAVIFRLRSPAEVSCCRTCRHHFPDVPVQTECPHLPAVRRVCNTSVRYAG